MIAPAKDGDMAAALAARARFGDTDPSLQNRCISLVVYNDARMAGGEV